MNVPTKKQLENVPHSRLNGLKFIIEYLDNNSVSNKKVVDLSAGTGFVAKLWKDKGALIDCFDLHPPVFEQPELHCRKIDLNVDFPIADAQYDYVLLMETIEHIPDQLHLMKEIARILKVGGKLIVTKPNNSNFAGRFANFWTEAERSDMYLSNEESVISYENGNVYLGRFFLCSAQKLRSLAALNGLNIKKIYANQISNSSLIFGSIFYPFLVLKSFLTLKKLISKNNPQNGGADVLKQQHQLNTNPTILFHKHFCCVFEK